MRRALVALTLLAAAGARAGDNDLQLWRLGHPDDIRVCPTPPTCNGGTVLEGGDPGAQMRFARLAASLGLSFVPAFQDQAQTSGQSGFELGFSGHVAYPKLGPQEWPTAGSLAIAPAPSALFFPTIAVRKGLGGSVEVGAAVSLLTGSQMAGLSGQVRWAPFDGLYWAPDVALRAWGTRVVGAQELQLTEAGADLLVSRSFGLAGTVKLQPYAQYGIAFINAESGVVDFRPGSEDLRNPSADDGAFHTVPFWQNRYHRFVAGLRFVTGSLLVGVEGSVAVGTNPVQRDSPIQQFTRVWTTSGRLGLAF